MPYDVELVLGMLDGKTVTVQSPELDIHVDVKLQTPAVIYLTYFHWVRMYFARVSKTKAYYRGYEYLPPGVPVVIH